MKTEYPSPVVKQAGREADHSLPISAEGENKWSYTSNPLCAATVAQWLILTSTHLELSSAGREGVVVVVVVVKEW
jgi:hypothetical protein